jgi:hypothetical protein
MRAIQVRSLAFLFSALVVAPALTGCSSAAAQISGTIDGYRLEATMPAP